MRRARIVKPAFGEVAGDQVIGYVLLVYKLLDDVSGKSLRAMLCCLVVLGQPGAPALT